MTPTKNETWALLLAGGEGNRLRGLTVDETGGHLPKQFCALGTGSTLLRRTVERASTVVPRSRLMAAVTECQRRWWEGELTDVPVQNLVVQPHNRGTAPAVLLSLLWLTKRSPSARLVILPSDHYVENEEVLDASIRTALRQGGDRVVLLGVSPDRADTEVGWIRTFGAADSSLQQVESFVEKPSMHNASELLRERALINTLIVVTSAASLLSLYRDTMPELRELLEAGETRGEPALADVAARVYEEIPSLDFSSRVLEPAARAGQLWALQVPPCGWSDLGTPERVRAVRRGVDGPAWRLSLERAPGRYGSDYWLG